MRQHYFNRQDAAIGLTVFTAFCLVGNLEQAAPACALGETQSPVSLVQTVGEDPDEAALIEAALVEQGYFREDVPLSYELQDHLHTICEDTGVEYTLALGLIEVESGFQVDAGETGGSYGLCQLNPKYFPSGLSPEENMRAGMEYLADCLRRYDGHLVRALTAYNAGHDTGSRRYANAVLEAAQRWGEP